MICCSEFLKTKMDSNPLFARKTVAMHNFVDRVEWKEVEKKDYVLYFGRFSKEKGIDTLLKVCRELPDVQFVFAGTGPLENEINGITNIKNVGFQSGEALKRRSGKPDLVSIRRNGTRIAHSPLWRARCMVPLCWAQISAVSRN